jgi:hypothetical protein
LLLAFVDFKEDHFPLFGIAIADCLAISLSLQVFFPLFQFLFQVFTLLFPAK